MIRDDSISIELNLVINDVNYNVRAAVVETDPSQVKPIAARD